MSGASGTRGRAAARPRPERRERGRPAPNGTARARGGRPGAAGASASDAVGTRVAAVRLLERLLAGGGSLTRLLPPAQRALPSGERARLQLYAYGLARWSGQLEGLVGRLLERPLKPRDGDLGLLLRLGLYELLHTRAAPHAAVDATVATAVALGKPWARGLVNAVLRGFLRRREALLETLGPHERLAHPPWLLARLRADWPADWERICAANNRQGPLTLRVNLARGSRERYRERLAAEGLAARTPAAVGDVALPAALTLERAVPVEALPGFAAGEASVQDAAAQLAVALLERHLPRGARLLDACAAPGGKTAQALESGHFVAVTALERDAARLERLGETLARLGFAAAGADAGGADASAAADPADADERPAVRTARADAADTGAWWDGRPFDAVLVDAPCTATGVIRRHPDVKLLRRETDVAALAAEQRRLLEALWPVVAPGGALLYATCSLLREEGEAQIERFLAARADARLVAEHRLLPGENDMDGFYHALLARAP